jgi:hypothetical protein
LKIALKTIKQTNKYFLVEETGIPGKTPPVTSHCYLERKKYIRTSNGTEINTLRDSMLVQ